VEIWYHFDEKKYIKQIKERFYPLGNNKPFCIVFTEGDLAKSNGSPEN